MRLCTVIAIASLLGGCGSPLPSESKSEKPKASEQIVVDPNYTPTRLPPPDFDSKGNRIFTAEDRSYYPIAKYNKFPREVAALMQQAAIEHDWCKGHGDDPETFRACNRSEVILYKIMNLGYCWGSSDPMAIAAQFEWLKCSEDAHHASSRPIGEPRQFGEEYIADIERSTNARAGRAVEAPRRQ